MTTTTRDLPTLHLDQTDVPSEVAHGLIDGDRFQRWFVHIEAPCGVGFWTAGKHELDRNGNHAFASVTVVLPTVMIGGAGEIREDVKAAVERHAEKHLGPA